MIIKIKSTAKPEEIELLTNWLTISGYQIHNASSNNVKIYGVIGDTSLLDIDRIVSFSAVEEAHRVATPFKKVSRAFKEEDTVIEVKGHKIGGNNPVFIIAGPCSVESYENLSMIAKIVQHIGASALRGGAYKPRTSPYAFQGLQSKGVDILKRVSLEENIITCSEIMSSDKLEEFEKNIDIIQVGARNMQNFELLKVLGTSKKPILLKRGLASTIEEWLMSAEYIVANGNPNVILCERGIRTFEKYTRNTLDVSVIPLVKKLSHLPIIVDPSHSTGKRDLVEAVSLAAIVTGADGLIIEVHNNPECALSDGAQSITFEQFESLMKKGRRVAEVIDRKL
ncbi:MAG: 3-deoxy-7-phosphoheptulonate synthase [Bacillales bacterium]|jgi:3-deoxy-7-phosphoheptulonate synthase|nr:3-deoxy-7-phosphoheptulonate synthase [Bacillales bacterium]